MKVSMILNFELNYSSVLKNRTVVKTILCEDQCYELVLRDDEINLSNTLVEFLTFFEKATQLMSGEQYASISLVIPTIRRLKQACTVVEGDADLLKLMKQLAMNSLNKRFENVHKNVCV
jgi:hypothetical protein